jgi:hypothetical protein
VLPVRKALYAAAAASIAVLLALRPTQQPFPLLYGREDALALSESLDELLGLRGGAKVAFFEVGPSSVCAARALGLPTLAGCRGKEWVVRAYVGSALAYELRVDASLGFSSLRVNLSFTDLGRAVAAAAELLRTARPGLYIVDAEGGALSVSAWEELPEVCARAQSEAAQWAWVSSLASVGLHAVLIAALIVAVAMDTPGVSKGRATAVAVPLMLAVCAARSLLGLQYALGKRGLAPTLRSVVNLLYSDAMLALFSLVSLLAGAAILAKRGTAARLPLGRRLAESWMEGASVGLLLSALSAAAFSAAARAGALLPLSDPLLEQALSSPLPWAELALSAALSAVAVESLFRYLLPALLAEVTGSRGQAVALSSAVFALLYAGYPLYPPHAKVLQALAVAVALTLLALTDGLAAAVFANFTFNAVSSAVALHQLLPLDAAAIALSVAGALPAGYLVVGLARRALR